MSVCAHVCVSVCVGTAAAMSGAGLDADETLIGDMEIHSKRPAHAKHKARHHSLSYNYMLRFAVVLLTPLISILTCDYTQASVAMAKLPLHVTDTHNVRARCACTHACQGSGGGRSSTPNVAATETGYTNISLSRCTWNCCVLT